MVNTYKNTSKPQKLILKDLLQQSFDEQNDEFDFDSNGLNQHLVNNSEELLDERNYDVGTENEAQADSIKITEQDLQEAKQQSYEEGKNDAQEELAAKYQELEEKRDFYDILHKKLLDIHINVSDDDYKNHLIQLLTHTLTEIGTKLHLILPKDFETFLYDTLQNLIKKYHIEGAINLKVSPEMFDYSVNVLKSEELPSKLKNKFNVQESNSLEKHDCIIEVEGSKFKYEEQDINQEIKDILAQLEKIAYNQ